MSESYTEIDRLIFAIRIAEDDFISCGWRKRKNVLNRLIRYYKELSEYAEKHPEDFTYKHLKHERRQTVEDILDVHQTKGF